MTIEQPAARSASAPIPRSGDVVLVGEAASVQFAGGRGFVFRVVRVDPRLTYDGWIWLHGYVLDKRAQAVELRDIFVRAGGIRAFRNPARPIAKHQARQS